MVDIEVIETRLKLLGDYIKDLQPFQKLSPDEYSQDGIAQAVVERKLQLAIQVCLDIGSHILSEEGFREPEDNKDVFVILEEEGIIPADFLGNLIKMAKFRNILVHNYVRIDHKVVYDILRENLKDFDRFSNHIVEFVERSRNP